MRIGSDRLINVDFRLIAATNKKLEDAVREGSFRSDLFFRLNVLPISIPPLRRRKEDLPLLLQHFLGSRYKEITPEQMQATPSICKRTGLMPSYSIVSEKTPVFLPESAALPCCIFSKTRESASATVNFEAC